MVFFISFIFFILAAIGFTKDNRIVSPLFVGPFIWALFLLFYEIIPNTLFPLQAQFLIALSLWVCFFFIFCFFTTITDFHFKPISLYSKKLFNIYFYTILILAPLALVLIILEALKVGPELFFLKLRIMNTGIDEEETFSLGPLGYIFNFSSVIALLFTYYIERISRTKYITVISLAFLLALITLARTSLVSLSIGLFIVLYFKGKIKRKQYIYFGVIFFTFIFLVTALRGLSDTQDTSLSDTFSLYLFGGMPAFDTIQIDNSEEFGSHVFRLFYAILNAFGGNFQVKENILPYTNVPELTNVYTVLYPFFKDFGYYGVSIFGAIYGLLFGLVFKFAKKMSPIMILMFAFLFPSILLQFIGESIFSNLSTYLQYTIILLLTQRLRF